VFRPAGLDAPGTPGKEAPYAGEEGMSLMTITRGLSIWHFSKAELYSSEPGSHVMHTAENAEPSICGHSGIYADDPTLGPSYV
jgi:hypothetical protein